MISRPFQNKQHRTSRQRSTQHAQIPQIKDRFVFSIQSMEMRRVVIPPNLLNHDTIEDTEVGMTVFSCTVRHGESAVSVPGGTFHTGSEDEGIADTENRDGSQLPLASTFSNRLQPQAFSLRRFGSHLRSLTDGRRGGPVAPRMDRSPGRYAEDGDCEAGRNWQ